MKKILIILSVIIVLLAQHYAVKAQTPAKPTEPPKEQFKLDNTKPITVAITFTLPVGSLDSYLFVEQQGGVQAVTGSDKLTGAQITYLAKVHQAVTDSLNNAVYRKYQAFVKTEQQKFTADTTAKYHKK